jgi:hypothetical protein
MEKDENKNTSIKNEVAIASTGALRFFSTDKDFVFILKKTEKLTSAIYLISGFFDDQEPLKWKLRNLSNSLLSASLTLKDNNNANRDKTILDIEGIILEIGSLLLVAKHAGLISEMNYSIINKEFNLFADSITLKSEGLIKKGGGEINPNFFYIENPEKIWNKAETAETIKTNLPKETIKDNDLEREIKIEPILKTTDPIEYKSESFVPASKSQKLDESFMARGGVSKEPKLSKPLKDFGAVAVKKNSRQSIIISLLRRKKEIMIKDVSPLIEGCSEKTIQRELLAMVNMGILKKVGEKRWSRYSLA